MTDKQIMIDGCDVSGCIFHLYTRYKNGWDIEKMLTTNVGEK